MNMFEIQRAIFTEFVTAIHEVDSSCRVGNKFVYTPATFPYVSIVLSGDGTTPNTRDSSKIEKYRDITLTVDVYSNKSDGSKTEAESLMQAVQDKAYSLAFNMVSCSPNSNTALATIYRLSATFTATVDWNGNIYARR